MTLTGSEGAGVSVGRSAGAQIKKAVLELGGSDPFIVMPSADLEAAASTAVKARTINNGQSCIAAKRFIVHRRRRRRLREAVRREDEGSESRRPDRSLGRDRAAGDAGDPRRGGRISCGAPSPPEPGSLSGASRLDGPGNFYPPTVLADIPTGSPADVEEIFGPVASLFRVGSLDEAIAVANRTRFGLGSSAWTRDPAERDRLVRELEAGSVFINGMVKSDPRLPFGGVKKSGFGRELSEHGIREFVNVKTVWEA